MSDQGADGLQFENAEYETPAPASPTCAACHRPIHDAYYELSGVVFCDACRNAVMESREGGSGVARFLRAGVYGAAAAVAGFALYFGVLKATGLQIGLISILVGLMVGKAVQKGSNGRGGWLYQLLAVFLTYTAVAASYSAVVFPQLLADMKAKGAAAKNAGAQAAAPGDAKAADPADEEEGDGPDIRLRKMTGGQFAATVAVTLAVAVVFAYAIPIIAGFSSPIGLLIIGFALWEAWKINKRVRIVFNGPFAVAAEPGPAEAPGYA